MTNSATRTPLSIRTILFLVIGLLTLLITMTAMRETYIEWQKLEKIKQLGKARQVNDQLFDVVEQLGIERDIALTRLNTDEIKTLNILEPRLQTSRQFTNKLITAAFGKIELHNKALEEERQRAERLFTEFKTLREEVDQAMALPLDKRKQLSKKWFDGSTAMILEIQTLWMRHIKLYTGIDSIVTLHMRYKHFLSIIMEYSGRERALIGRLIAANADPTPEEQADLLRWQGAVNLSWERVGSLADQSGLYVYVEPLINDARSHYQTVYDMIGDSFYTPGKKHGDTYPISGEFWLEVAMQANDSLNALKNAAFEQTRIYTTELEENAQRSIIFHISLLFLALSICAYSFWVITYRVIKPINQMINAMLDIMHGRPAPVLPATAGRDDEIGKLAQVLHSFQQNVAEIKLAQEHLKRYTSDLERSNKELDDFAYIASHDLKEPLRGLHNHARFLLEDNKDKLEPESTKRLDRLVYLSQRMERLVNDLLYFSRLGRHELAIQPTDINMVIHDIENTLDVFLEEKNGKISTAGKLPIIIGDKTRITELFRNLITNAMKYNTNSPRTVEIGFLDKHPKNAIIMDNVFYVKDNGLGIAPEFHEEIFRIFKRLQSDKEEEGTGVGLTFVKKIVERHGGKIWLESEPGKGTTFYFTLEGNL